MQTVATRLLSYELKPLSRERLLVFSKAGIKNRCQSPMALS
jgi:hypothetical protein